MTQQPKRQHYIPRMLLNNFTDKHGRLYFFDKRSHKKEVLPSTPNKLFTKKHFYSQYDESGKRHPIVEKFLSHIESDSKPVVDRIINSARISNVPKLNLEDKETWDTFFCCQIIRVPEMIDPFIDHKSVDEIIEDYEKEIGPLTEEERTTIEDPNKRDRIIHNAKGASIINYLMKGELLPNIRKKGLAIAIIKKPKKSFIVGSKPYIKTADWNHISEPNAELWLPIAYDVAVSPAYYSGKEELLEIKDHKVRDFNKYVCDESSLIAGRSKILINSLVNSR